LRRKFSHLYQRKQLPFTNTARLSRMEENEYNEELNGIDEDDIANDKSKSDKLSELRRKEQGQKHEVTKIDYASHLKKTQKPETGFREKKRSANGPNYLENLKKTDAGVSTQPEYMRLAKKAEVEGKHIDRKFTAEELIDMAFKKAEDADKRDPAARRGITQKHAAAPGTFQGIQVKDDEKADYKSVLKQHVTVEPKTRPKVEENKPSWANIAPKRVVEADIKKNSKENKQEKPEWAQFGRGSTKHVVEHMKHTEKSQTPEWASFANKTDRKKLIQLEQKKTAGNSDSSQPEWAAKSRDAKEILRVEHKTPKKLSGSDDAPDYKGVLRRSSRKE